MKIFNVLQSGSHPSIANIVPFHCCEIDTHRFILRVIMITTNGIIVTFKNGFIRPMQMEARRSWQFECYAARCLLDIGDSLRNFSV